MNAGSPLSAGPRPSSPIGRRNASGAWSVGCGWRWASAAIALSRVPRRSVDADIEGRARRHRRHLHFERVAEHAGQRRLEPGGKVVEDGGRRAGEFPTQQALVLRFAQGLRRVPLAIAQLGDGRGGQAARPRERPQKNGAGGVRAHQPGGGRAPAQRVEHVGGHPPRGRETRRNGGRGRSPSAPRRPGGDASRSPRRPRWRRTAGPRASLDAEQHAHGEDQPQKGGGHHAAEETGAAD